MAGGREEAEGEGGLREGWRGTSFRLKVGDAVHDHVVQKQGLVVHFDGAGEQAAEVMHVPAQGEGSFREGPGLLRGHRCSPSARRLSLASRLLSPTMRIPLPGLLAAKVSTRDGPPAAWSPR